MWILSGIYVWANIVDMTADGLKHFQQNSVSCVVMNLVGVLYYHFGMCILSGIYVWANIIEMMAV